MNCSPYTLGDRTLAFSKAALQFCKDIRLTTFSRPLVNQLVRSVTSIGANYAEANNAASPQDFCNKIVIAKKEAAETEYWLGLFEDFTDDKEALEDLKTECHFILMTLQKIISTLRGRQVNSKK